MSYPAGHTPTANDGIQGLLQQIADAMDVLAGETDGIEDILAKIAAAATAAAAGAAPPSGPAGGDLSGTYPDPTVAKVAGVTPTAAGLALLDDANAAAQRTTLGLGTLALENAATMTLTLLPTTTNTLDLGSTGKRFKDVWVAGIITTATVIADQMATFNYLQFVGGPIIRNGGTGKFFLDEDGATPLFIQLGGTSSSYPAFKRSTTTMQVRLADDSAYGGLSAEIVTVAAGTATPANGSTAARLLFGTTSGFGIYYGSAAPTVSAGQGSLYLRSDGTTVNDRAYINNSSGSGTTWTALVTSA